MQKGYMLKERDFFKNPFSKDEIKTVLEGNPAFEMFNFKSPNFGKLGLDRNKLSDEDLLDLMLGEPRLVKRPVIVINGKTHFGASAKYLEEQLKI